MPVIDGQKIIFIVFDNISTGNELMTICSSDKSDFIGFDLGLIFENWSDVNSTLPS